MHRFRSAKRTEILRAVVSDEAMEIANTDGVAGLEKWLADRFGVTRVSNP